MKNILTISKELDYFITKISYAFRLPKTLVPNNSILRVNENGDIFWDVESITESKKYCCPRCYNELDLVDSNVSLFSPTNEKILKCKKCGWC